MHSDTPASKVHRTVQGQCDASSRGTMNTKKDFRVECIVGKRKVDGWIFVIDTCAEESGFSGLGLW